jgi:hypothetical protein
MCGLITIAARVKPPCAPPLARARKEARDDRRDRDVRDQGWNAPRGGRRASGAKPPGWRAILHLLHESCLHGAVGAPRGGVHARKSAEAHDAHGGACKARIAGAFGSAPAFGYFETAVVVGNRTNADAAPAA